MTFVAQLPMLEEVAFLDFICVLLFPRCEHDWFPALLAPVVFIEIRNGRVLYILTRLLALF